MAMYESKQGEEDFKISSYYKKDYRSFHTIATIIWVTVGYAVAVGIGVIAFLDELMGNLNMQFLVMLAAFLNIPTWRAIPICLVGNLIPIPFILLLIRPIFAWLRKTRLFRPLVEKLEKKAMSKSDRISRYEFWGLVLFVGIPLPGTGAWTGALVASLLGIDWKKAFGAIVVGVCMASVIMYILSYVVIGGIFG